MSISNYQFLAFVLGELIFYPSLHLFYTGLLGKIQPRRKILILSVLMIIADISMYSLQINTLIRILFSLTLYITISFLYSSKKIRNIIFSILFYLIINIIELTVFYSMAFVFNVSLNTALSNNLVYIISTFLCRFILLLICYIIYIISNKYNISENSTHFWIIITIFFSGSIYVLYFVSSLTLNGKITNYPEVLLICLIVFIFNISIYLMYDNQCKDAILKQENEQLHQYLNIQKAEQQVSAAYNEYIANTKHDLKSLFCCLNSLMDSKDYSAVSDIIKEHTDILITSNSAVSTPDMVLNSILSNKISLAESKHITVETKLLVTESIPIKYDNLSILLGDIIDNSIEYLSTHEVTDKYISINVFYDYGILKLSVINPVIEYIVITNNSIPSTKSGSEHGHGINSVKKIIDYYDGLINISCVDNEFKFEISIGVAPELCIEDV